MENVLFYLLIILCLGLIITTAVYMNRFNNMKMLFESADKTNDNLLQERMTLQKQIAEVAEVNLEVVNKMETKKGQIKQIVPNELMDQTQIISTILHSINTYNNLYPKESTKFNRELIEAINGTIMERSKKTK
jgi:hypothetical protein